MEDAAAPPSRPAKMLLNTRPYQQEMLSMSLKRNVIIALDTGSGKTHIAILRIKHEMEREKTKLCWFLAPTVALCEQQHTVISGYIPTSVGIVSGSHYPDQWKNEQLWKMVVDTHRVMVSTPQVLLDALRHGYLSLGLHISLLVFDEAHHAIDKHPYNMIMQEFYFGLPRQGMLCRPSVLGLSASPIYGSGDIQRAFRTIESNLDSMICTPQEELESLSRHVHRPIFKHASYFPPNPDDLPFSTNHAALRAVLSALDIEDDPYVIALRKQLKKLAPTPTGPHTTTPPTKEYLRVDQKLSKVINKQDSFTHKGLRDFERAAADILYDLGAWAADWFVYTVVEKAKQAANPFNNIMMTWKNEEKQYLLSILKSLVLSPVSYYEDDIIQESSDKVRTLIQTLLDEKEAAESRNEDDNVFSGLVFVQRRDSVLALSHLLQNHPTTKSQFRIGTLLGSSEASQRHSMMDITRHISASRAAQPSASTDENDEAEKPKSLQKIQQKTLAEFKSGEKNLLIATAVAEEGLDIQACGCVVRWDPPPNMASWVQSRGRARKKKSVFVVLYNVLEDDASAKVEKWKMLEEQMKGTASDAGRNRRGGAGLGIEDGDREEPGDFDMELRSETGATINPHSAVSHLSHFCAIISRSGSIDNRPIYDIDPPDFYIGWHEQPTALPAYQGPWSSTVTLPRSLPIPKRSFTTRKAYPTKLAAYRHAAFEAYRALWEWELLNEHLLPFTGGKDPELEEEVKKMLSEVEKREGMVGVSLQVDPWAPDAPTQGGQGVWYLSEMHIDGLPPLLFLTLRPMERVERENGPMLFRPGRDVTRVGIVPRYQSGTSSVHATVSDEDDLVARGREYTRMIFWCFYNARMDWDKLDFSYLVLPLAPATSSGIWDARRSWLRDLRVQESTLNSDAKFRSDLAFVVEGDTYAKEFGYSEDLVVVKKHLSFGRPLKFVGWRYEKLSEEEEEAVLETYGKGRAKSKANVSKEKEGPGEGDVDMADGTSQPQDKVEIPYPLLVAEPFPPRSNFLHPLPTPKSDRSKMDIDLVERGPPKMYLIPSMSGIALYSAEETEYAFLLPSILRWLSIDLTVGSFQSHHWAPLPPPNPLSTIPRSLLTVALTAPMSGERFNYQRLETLGDTVLKFVVGIQMYDEFPMWHEGYLTRGKDHAVSNFKLAKENFKREVFRWIVRDMMLGKKWLPKYVTPRVTEASSGEVASDSAAGAVSGGGAGGASKDATGVQDVVMDVVGGTVLDGSSADRAIVVDDEDGQANVADRKKADDVVPPLDKKKRKKKRRRDRDAGKIKPKIQQLSTKVLADVVEALIGAAFEHGGFDLGYECAKFFDLGVKWKPLPERFEHILSTIQPDSAIEVEIPSQIANVESMLGYTFQRKIILIEALTHASYREHVATISYERLEFLGDGVLDMVVTDYLYHAPGKSYSPGHMHLRKSAVVNGLFLAYICLGLQHTYDAVMPQVVLPDGPGGGMPSNPYTANLQFAPGADTQEIHLYKCLLHSNQQVLDDQTNTWMRYEKWRGDIQEALEKGDVYPWAALTRLQAPKFLSDMVESIIGGVFVDSGGNLDVVKGVLRKIGILDVLERIVNDNVDVLHPVSRLSMWASRNKREVEYVFERDKGDIVCVIKVDGVEEVRERERYRGKTSQEEVKFAAAEKAIGVFKVRDGSSRSGVGEKKGRGKGKQRVDTAA